MQLFPFCSFFRAAVFVDRKTIDICVALLLHELYRVFTLFLHDCYMNVKWRLHDDRTRLHDFTLIYVDLRIKLRSFTLIYVILR